MGGFAHTHAPAAIACDVTRQLTTHWTPEDYPMPLDRLFREAGAALTAIPELA